MTGPTQVLYKFILMFVFNLLFLEINVYNLIRAECARFVRLCMAGALVIMESRMTPRHLAVLVYGMLSFYCDVIRRVISLIVKGNRFSFIRVYCEFPFLEVIYYSVNMILLVYYSLVRTPRHKFLHRLHKLLCVCFVTLRGR